MKKLVVLLILLAALLSTSGCSEKILGNFTNSKVGLEKNDVLIITQLKQINTALQQGPIFVKIGTRWCPTCRSMNPILEKLAVEYRGKATIASIDVDQSSELAEYFGVKYLPDSFAIVGIENGKYVYMQNDGKVSTDRSQAKIIGLNTTDDGKMFEKIIDLALLQEGKSKSQ
jgi:thiol-disulfide isomerase/thioredoxin